MKRTLKKINGP